MTRRTNPIVEWSTRPRSECNVSYTRTNEGGRVRYKDCNWKRRRSPRLTFVTHELNTANQPQIRL
jgi:hypothetical protein